MEYDKLLINQKPIVFSKIILGSFPTWALTSPDKDKGETSYQKNKKLKENGDVPYFYGQKATLFWSWYS